MTSPRPASILIIGSGVFGLSTALSLTRRPQYSQTTITVLDRSPFPAQDGSSIDNSRIVRADYSSPAYASLGAKAQQEWRKTGSGELGGDGRYSESGLVLVADSGYQGEEYVRSSWENVQSIMAKTDDKAGVRELSNPEAIKAAVSTGGSSGSWGYINNRSGWADAEASMIWLRKQTEATGRVAFLQGQAKYLLKSADGKKVHGAKLTDGRDIHADLTILAMGGWTGSLTDLRGRATATGQVLGYVPLTTTEQHHLGRMPVLLNMSSGLFIIPPRNRILKVARHAYGYTNPTQIPNPDKLGIPGLSPGDIESITVSLPCTVLDDPAQQIPPEGDRALRAALAEMVPGLATRPFTHTRICWYNDTPTADFLVAYHPHFEGLFLATGGSGHAFKFLGVLGESIVDCVQGACPVEFADLWRWPERVVERVVTEDGSRGGKPGLVLEEMRGEKGKL